jgi:hypothetical protein
LSQTAKLTVADPDFGRTVDEMLVAFTSLSEREG